MYIMYDYFLCSWNTRNGNVRYIESNNVDMNVLMILYSFRITQYLNTHGSVVYLEQKVWWGYNHIIDRTEKGTQIKVIRNNQMKKYLSKF